MCVCFCPSDSLSVCGSEHKFSVFQCPYVCMFVSIFVYVTVCICQCMSLYVLCVSVYWVAHMYICCYVCVFVFVCLLCLSLDVVSINLFCVSVALWQRLYPLMSLCVYLSVHVCAYGWYISVSVYLFGCICLSVTVGSYACLDMYVNVCVNRDVTILCVYLYIGVGACVCKCVCVWYIYI